MLKDRFVKFFNKNREKDPINISIMDGFVDIKGYRYESDGNKKLVYHDCGDNVVTDWMRHAIMVMLTGNNFSSFGRDNNFTSANLSRKNSEGVTLMPADNHISKSDEGASKAVNYDGYMINGEQYFWSGKNQFPLKYSKTMLDANTNKFAMFPTKVLFGTGKEYSSWEVLQTENETANATWYTEMLNSFGGDVNTATVNFNSNIDLSCNSFSGSIAKNIYTGNGSITKMRTVNDPDDSSNVIATTSTMNKNYGVVGAIKTIYFDSKEDADLLQSTLTDNGKLLKPINRGVGRPCFIYFTAPAADDEVEGSKRRAKEGWDDAASDVFLSKDSTSDYLNKITFKIKMPAQSSADNAVGEYYPYNGYTLKQMGLYNDSLLGTSVKTLDESTYPYGNMPCGMLLAVKNITAFAKTADVELNLTWTLTI